MAITGDCYTCDSKKHNFNIYEEKAGIMRLFYPWGGYVEDMARRVHFVRFVRFVRFCPLLSVFVTPFPGFLRVFFGSSSGLVRVLFGSPSENRYFFRRNVEGRSKETGLRYPFRSLCHTFGAPFPTGTQPSLNRRGRGGCVFRLCRNVPKPRVVKGLIHLSIQGYKRVQKLHSPLHFGKIVSYHAVYGLA